MFELDYCFSVDETPDIEHTRDHLLGVLDALYVTGDTERLEDSLEEVCTELKVCTKPIGGGFKLNLLDHMATQRDQIKLMKTGRR